MICAGTPKQRVTDCLYLPGAHEHVLYLIEGTRDLGRGLSNLAPAICFRGGLIGPKT